MIMIVIIINYLKCQTLWLLLSLIILRVKQTLLRLRHMGRRGERHTVNG